jgi:membrane fusion protein, heavy metal efflux system
MDLRQTVRRLAIELRETLRALVAAVAEISRSVWSGFRRTSGRMQTAVVCVAALCALVVYWEWPSTEGSRSEARMASASAAVSDASSTANDLFNNVNLSDSQLASVKVEPIEERDFPVEKEAVGSIDFNEDMETQVFTPYQGKIIAL